MQDWPRPASLLSVPPKALAKTVTPTTSLPVFTGTARAMAFPQTQTSNGVEIQLTDVRIQDGQLSIDVCYSLPSQDDWLLVAGEDGVLLTINAGESIPSTSFRLIEFRTSPDGTKTHRCDLITFATSDAEMKSLHATYWPIGNALTRAKALPTTSVPNFCVTAPPCTTNRASSWPTF